MALWPFLMVTGSASEYSEFITQYKAVLCVGLSRTAPLSEKVAALQRQNELNRLLIKIQAELPTQDKANFSFALAKAMAEASEGKCP